MERVLRDRALRRDVLAAHRSRARRRDGSRRQPGRRELCRAGDLLDPGDRGGRAGPAPPPPPQPRSRPQHLRRGVPHAAQPGRRTGAARSLRGAAAGPPGDQPACHADRDRAGRRAASAARCTSASDRERRDLRVRRRADRAGADRDRHARPHGVRRDPAAHGRHVRRVGGLGLDLRLRRPHRRASRRPRGRRHLGRVAAPQVALRRARRPRRRRSLLHQRHGRDRDRPGALRRVLRRARQDARRRHGLPRRGRRRARRDRPADRRGPLPAR